MGAPCDQQKALLQAENDSLRRENAQLHERLRDASLVIELLCKELTELRARLNANSTNSSQPPSQDKPGVRRPQRPRSTRHRGGQPGHPGHQRPLLPPERVQHVIPCRPSRCHRCQHPLRGDDSTPSRHQVAELPPITPVVTEYQLHELECVACGATTRASLPVEAVSFLGPRASGIVSALSGRIRLTTRLIGEVFDLLFDLPLSPATICRVEQTASEAVAEPVEEAREELRKQPVVSMDVTSWREQHRLAWLWVAASPVVVAFTITATHTKAVAQRILGLKFGGRLVTDRGGEYLWFDVKRRQLCWAHLARNFQGWAEREGTARWYGEQLVELTHQLFHEWHRFQHEELTRLGFRRVMAPLRQRVEALLEAAQRCEDETVARSAAAIFELRPALWTFVGAEGVEPTNNLSEQLLRPAVIRRMLSLGTQSERGSRFVERILTVCATLKQQGRNVLEYLTQAIQAYTHAQPAPSLLPVRA